MNETLPKDQPIETSTENDAARDLGEQALQDVVLEIPDSVILGYN
ncbi:MAG: hypothetical protein ACREF7_01825 [Candidatus Saccharimonadales bacterium]